MDVWTNVLEKLIARFGKGGPGHSDLVKTGLGDLANYFAETYRNALIHLRIYRARAFILAGEYEQAAETITLVPTEQALRSSLHSALDNVRNDLDDLLRAPDQRARPSEGSHEEQHGQALKIVSEAYSDIYGFHPPITDDTYQQMVRSFGLPIAPQRIEDLAAMAERLYAAAYPLPTLRTLAAQIATVYCQEAEVGHGDLERFARITGLAANYAERIDSWADMLRMRWMHGHFLKRLGLLEVAAEEMRKTRDAIERRRLKIRNPRLRAGLAVFMKYLYASSAETAMKLGDERTAELFAIIESAKSRILTDLVEAKSAPPPEDVTSAELREREARLLGRIRDHLVRSQQRAHYLSYLVDDDVTYCVLLDCDGNLHCHSVPLGTEAFLKAVKHLRELVLGSGRTVLLAGPIRRSDPWRRPFDPVISQLSPLVDIVTRLRESSVIRDGDVLCYAPDGPIFNIPLQMLRSAGDELGEILTIVCAPSAQMLLTMANRRATPRKAIAIVAPRKASEEAAMRATGDCLQRFMPTVSVTGDHNLKRRLRGMDLTHAVIDFAMHGDFNAEHPLEKSGLLIPDCEDILAPQDLAALDMSGSHVTLRACVSGLATQITSREALGCIWAILQTGATSVLASAWHVDVESSGEYTETFYEAWLSGGHIGQAHQKAMTAMKVRGGALAHPYHWSPFILYGHWE